MPGGHDAVLQGDASGREDGGLGADGEDIDIDAFDGIVLDAEHVGRPPARVDDGRERYSDTGGNRDVERDDGGHTRDHGRVEHANNDGEQAPAPWNDFSTPFDDAGDVVTSGEGERDSDIVANLHARIDRLWDVHLNVDGVRIGDEGDRLAGSDHLSRFGEDVHDDAIPRGDDAGLGLLSPGLADGGEIGVSGGAQGVELCVDLFELLRGGDGILSQALGALEISLELFDLGVELAGLCIRCGGLIPKRRGIESCDGVPGAHALPDLHRAFDDAPAEREGEPSVGGGRGDGVELVAAVGGCGRCERDGDATRGDGLPCVEGIGRWIGRLGDGGDEDASGEDGDGDRDAARRTSGAHEGPLREIGRSANP